MKRNGIVREITPLLMSKATKSERDVRLNVVINSAAVTMAPAALELRVSWVDSTILTIPTQVVRAAALSISMTTTFAVVTVSNAIARGHIVTFLAAPIAPAFDGPRAVFFNRPLGMPDLPFAGTGGSGVKVTGNATIEAGVGIGISETARAAIEGLVMGFEFFMKLSNVASHSKCGTVMQAKVLKLAMQGGILFLLHSPVDHISAFFILKEHLLLVWSISNHCIVFGSLSVKRS